MMKRPTLSLFAIVLGVAILPAAAAETLNTRCPVAGKDIDPEKTSPQVVQFCCGKCKSKFDQAPQEFTTKVAEAEQGSCPISGKAIDEDETSEVLIGFCCGKCQAKYEADPAKYRKKLK